MIFEILASPGSIFGGLGSLLGPLGVVLGRSWGLLGRSWAILGRSWGILRRSWVALGGSWFAPRGSWVDPERSWTAKRAIRSASQGAWRTRVGRSYPPPVGFGLFAPPPLASIPLLPEAGRTRKMRLWNSKTTGKREDQIHREEGRVEGKKGMMTRGTERDAPHAQWPRGPADNSPVYKQFPKRQKNAEFGRHDELQRRKK